MDMTSTFDAVSVLWPVHDAAGREQRMVGVPSVDDPRQVLPWHWSSIVATAARRSDDRSGARRVRDAVGVAGLLASRPVTARHRMTVQVHGSLVDEVAATLGLPECRAIALCGPPRANQKPVLQFHDRWGRSRAFVKVGWSDLTRRLLADEHRALEHLAHSTDRGFDVPVVLGRGTFDAVEWLALAPLTVDRRRPPTAHGVDELARRVAATSASIETSAAQSTYVLALRRDHADLPVTSGAIEMLLERHGDEPLTCGASHGDFVPWNILTGHPRTAVWDWERYVHDAPIGFDRVHFSVQTTMRRRLVPLEDAVRTTSGRLADVLPEVPQSSRRAHLDWYLAGVLSRYERDARDHPTGRLTGWVDVLDRLLKEPIEP